MVPLRAPVLPRTHLSAEVVQARAARASDRGNNKGRCNQSKTKGTAVHARTSTPHLSAGVVQARAARTSGRGSSKGRGNQSKSKRHRCARPPNFHAPTFRRRSSELGRRAHRTGGSSKGRGNRWHHAHARTSTPPPFGGGRPSSGRRVQDRAKGTNCARPNSHAPTFRRGSSELQGDAHSGPGRGATKRWG